MSRNSKIFWVTIIVVVFVVLGCWYLSKTSSVTSSGPTTAVIESSAKLINSFSFLGLNPEVDGAVDNTNYAINLLVPNGTDVTELIPTIAISDGANISPNSGVAQDFTNPVIYTVTAQDGSTQSYVVTVTSGSPGQPDNAIGAESSDNSISAFAFSGLSPEVDGVVDNNAHTVSLTVPVGTDITNLVPTISIPDGATIYPYSDVAEDFTNPIIYTVTAQDGSIEDYTVTVTTAQAPTQ
jgi:hypothetical protein